MPRPEPTAPAVLITGASSGIGEAAAMRLAELGWKVFAGVRREADAERLAKQAPGRLTPVRLDVTDPEAIAAAAHTVEEATGDAGLAGLVNNAGISMIGPLELLPVDEWRRAFEVNVLGVVAMTQAVLPLLRAGRGRVVNVSSVSGLVAGPFLGAYAASKFALEALSDSLRLEVGGFGIRVSLIEPGPVKTPIWEKAQAQRGKLAEQTPPEKLALFEENILAVRKAVGKAEQRAISVGPVVRAIVHALRARRPKPRYVTPFHARLEAGLSRRLPDRWRDWLLRRALGIK